MLVQSIIFGPVRVWTEINWSVWTEPIQFGPVFGPEKSSNLVFGLVRSGFGPMHTPICWVQPRSIKDAMVTWKRKIRKSWVAEVWKLIPLNYLVVHMEGEESMNFLGQSFIVPRIQTIVVCYAVRMDRNTQSGYTVRNIPKNGYEEVCFLVLGVRCIDRYVGTMY